MSTRPPRPPAFWLDLIVTSALLLGALVVAVHLFTPLQP